MTDFITNEWIRKQENNERLQKADEMAQIVRTTLPLIKTVASSVDELRAIDQLNKQFETNENSFQMLLQRAKDATGEELHQIDLQTISFLRDQAKLCRLYHDNFNQYIAKLKGASL